MERLPRGRHGLSAEFVARNQRERLISGLTQALYEVGYHETTVSLIGRRAAVSKSDFYKHFESKDDCFVAAYEAAIERIRERVVTACEASSGESWAERVPDAVGGLLDLFDEEPELASIALVEGLRAGRGVYDRYQAALESFVVILGRGAPRPAVGGEVPETADEAVIGGITSLLVRRILAGEGEQLSDLLPEIVEFTFSAYLGGEEARRIVSAG
ncbi:MAG TPA: TetR/AcrR family transcriptional regulator [Solirubrobacterales bacterium]|jgi:AcrR family transcriptional regulator|nr:TetR/AcrR family transcriptional regulator [Solirubrobacterales bacterium]